MTTRQAGNWILLAALAAGLPALAGPAGSPSLSVTEIVLGDNGDGDGFADTRETVSLQLRVVNTGTVNLSNVTAVLATDNPEHVCITLSSASIGSIAPGAEMVVPGAFEFYVLDSADRGALGLGPYDPLAAYFRISFDSDQGTFAAQPREFGVDLDLDVSGGAGPTSYFESFEGTLGSFEVENLDQGRSSYAGSDGFRCQYHDPDNPDGYGDVTGECFMGASPAHADAEFWGLSGPAFSPLGGRGFSGFHSLFFGIDLGPDDNWTTPLSMLEAVRTTQPIHLPADVRPVLSFMHQVSLADQRILNSVTPSAADRGVVMAQVADAAGDPAGPWIKIHAMRNDYDEPATKDFINCAFDPVDDGSTEDDRTPGDEEWGPSSTCWPEAVYSFAGETSNPFDAANTGRVDGPGEQGTWGIGTWVESRFDLDRFRGRSIRLRFLATAIRGSGSEEDWEDRYNWNPLAGDDGWWIDDVAIDHALITPATATVDANANTGLPAPPGTDLDADGIADVCDNCQGDPNPPQQDFDYDGRGNICDVCPWLASNPDADSDWVCDPEDNCLGVANTDQTDADADTFGAACDCNDADPNFFPGAAEINDALDNNCDGLADELTGTAGFNSGNKTTFSWPAQSGTQRYHVVRGDAPDFSGSCDLSIALTASYEDATIPASGVVFHYLARPWVPNLGSFGYGASGERVIPCAP